MDWGWSQDYSPGGHSSKCWFLISQYRFPVFGSPHIFRKFPRNFRKMFSKIFENFAKISEKYVVIRKREIDIVRWEINILMNDLRENDPEIIPNPSVKYLRNIIFHVFRHLFPTPFMYLLHCMRLLHSVLSNTMYVSQGWVLKWLFSIRTTVFEQVIHWVVLSVIRINTIVVSSA